MKIFLYTLSIISGLFLSSNLLSAQNYCEPVSNCMIAPIVDFSTTGANVNISNYSSGCVGTSGYHFYYNKPLKSSVSDTIIINIVPGVPTHSIGYAIWIDWNYDGDFDDTGEEVWNSGTYVQGTVSDTIFLPSNVSVGLKRMRLRSNYFAVPISPCGNTSWGETEDYPLLITLGSGTDMSMEKLLSPNVFTIGNNTIKVQVRNNGATTINSFDLGFQLNNGTPVIANNISQTINSGSAFSYQFANPMVAGSGSHQLKVWVTDANNIVPDSIPSNDTMLVSFCTGMSGTYSIGSTGDYASFNSAISAMSNCGVSGVTVFTILPGTYAEQLVIPEINGISASATVTFNGLDNTKVHLTKSISGSTDGLIVLDEADYFTFKNIKITNSSLFGNAILLKGSADYNTFDSCVISSTYYGISSSESNYTTVSNSKFTGGKTAIYFNGPASRCNYNKAINNSISGQSDYGINFSNQRFAQALSNKITSQANNAYAGIYANYSSGTQIEANIIEPFEVGIKVFRENYITQDSALFVNNIIGNFGSTNKQTGMDMNYAWNLRILHNTIALNSTGYTDTSHVGLFLYYALGSKIKNNIFYNTGKNILLTIKGTGYSGYVPYEIDNNLYYSTYNGAKFYNNGVYYSDLASFKKSTNFLLSPHNENSFFQDNPNFVSTTDFHLLSQYAPYNGTNLGVLYDVDGDSRCIYAHTIGADESSFNVNKPVAGFSVDDTVCLNSPITFINDASSNSALGHEWYLNGYYQTNSTNFTYTFPNYAAHDTVLLITKSCGGIDSFSKLVYIDSPNVKPISGFLANKNIVNPFDEVQLYSLSANCPSNWEWRITPEYVYDPQLGQQQAYYYMNFTNKNSQNPKLKFEYPGKYNVCLVSSNAIGSDTLCFYEYIYVIPVQYMCIYALPETQNSITGLLYDDGGPSSDYANGTGSICDFKLTPCADTLYFTFSEFEVNPGDYLRIYDGISNLGTPLWDVSVYGANGLTGSMAASGFDTTVISYSGNMYFEWSANNVGTNKGFIGEWLGSSTVEPPPVASFTCPDTVCLNVPVSFQNTSSGGNLRYAWSFDNSGFTHAISENPTYTFTTSGQHTVTLNVLNCGGDSSFAKSIFVIGGTAAPTADFIADNLNPFKTIDVVNFTDLSHANPLNPLGCIDYWNWSISPSTYTAVSSFPNGQNPRITFNDTGCYTVTLISGYGNSRDTLTKQCYIDPTDYCIPVVNNLNNDIGISKVEIASITKFSSSGMVGYTDYAGSISTYIDEYVQYTIDIHRISGNNAITRKVWIDWNIDGDFDDAGELVVQQASSNSLYYTDSFTVPVLSKYGSTRMRVGVCIAGYPNTPCGPNFFGEFEDYRLILRPYSIPPEVKLIGSDTLMVMQCFGFNDPGATATSVLYGNLTSQIVTTHNVDPNNAGVYTVNYTVSDPKGNTTIKKRTILVIAEATPPVITLIGNAVDTVNVMSTYNDPGVTSSDSCSGIDRVEVSGQVFTNFLGKFTLNYTAYDKNQNTASTSRLVYVIDTEAPVVQLIGNAVDTVEVFNSYFDSGVVYTDNYDQNPKLVVTGNVNTSKIGSYTLKYEVSDSSGNSSVLYRYVHVFDLSAPQISSNYASGDTIHINIFTSVYDKLNLSYSDNYNSTGDLTIVSSGTYASSFGTGSANSIGCYTLSHSATDVSNNSSSVFYVVCVEDLEKPIITLLGSSVINIKQWETADTNDMKVNVTDNYDNNPTIWVSGSYYDDYLKHDKDGFYNVIYHAKDQSGNEADTVIRYINVLPNISIDENPIDEQINLYPNPAKSIVYVSINLKESGNGVICIMNQLGQCVYTDNEVDLSQQIHPISIAHLASGMYHVRISTNEQLIIKKLILSK